MRYIQIIFQAGAVVLALGTALPLGAEENGALRVLHWSPETSTSTCIGAPRTPLCAAETYEACDTWHEPGLCETVGFDLPWKNEFGKPEGYAKLYIRKYIVLGERELKGSDIPESAPSKSVRTWGKPWKAGDTALLTQWTGCAPVESCVIESREDPDRAFGEGCPPVDCSPSTYRSTWPDPTPRTYILRQTPGGWNVIDMIFQRPAFPDQFWTRK